MKTSTAITAAALAVCLLGAAPVQLLAQATPAAPAASMPADPWPRVVDLSNGQVLVYQPQVNKWVDNSLDFRSAGGTHS